MKKQLLLVFLIMMKFYICSGQIQHLLQKPDCISANKLIAKDTILIDTLLDTAGVYAEVDPNSCMSLEYSSSWFKWTCTSSGTFAFTIIPQNNKDDIDFMIFESDRDDCLNKNIVRCMAAGEIINDDPNTIQNCLGNTGLSFSDEDIELNPGCRDGDDNFLKALDMIEGKTYNMVVNNFHRSGKGYQIVFEGDGEIGDVSLVQPETKFDRYLTSNFATELLYVQEGKSFSALKIFNTNGNLVLFSNETQHTINLSNLSQGLYFVAFYDKEKNMLKQEKFYVIKN